VAPTDLNNANPDPAQRPHIVNNSWGGGGGDNWYQASVDAWRAAGIYPVFSTGNSGPSCGTVGSPGDYGNVTGVGGWGHRTETIYSSSSKGQSGFADTENPDGYPYLKPQVSAPAVQIRSSVNTSDTAYNGNYSGTSMAAPHVAGTVALMWAAAPCLRGQFVTTENILKTTAMPKASDRVCGTEGPGTPPRPNNGTGWGVVDSYAAAVMAAGYCTQPVIVMQNHGFAGENCTPANGVPDPGEVVAYNLTLGNIGGIAATNLVATLQATGGVTSPSGPASYGALAGGASATRAFIFTVDPSLTCGGIVTCTFQLQDGALNLGTVSFTAQTGILQTLTSENFDGVTAPALPAGWVATVAQGTLAPWATVTTYADTAPNSVWTADPSSLSDNRLDSPSFAIPATGAQLSFRHRFVFEGSSTLFDGGVLEISIGGGAFQDILAAGGSFAQGGYVGTISSSFSNPLAGRAAWGLSQTSFGTVVVNLPAAAYGQNVVFRWRSGSDTSVSSQGWWVDSLQIYGGYVCCTGGGGPTYDVNFRDQYNRSELCLSSATGDYVYNVLSGAHAGDSFTGTAAITPYGTTLFLFASPCPAGSTHCLSGNWNVTRHTAAATLKAFTPARYSQTLSDANYLDSPPCGVK
jgi:hypothetical protein